MPRHTLMPEELYSGEEADESINDRVRRLGQSVASGQAKGR